MSDDRPKWTIGGTIIKAALHRIPDTLVFADGLHITVSIGVAMFHVGDTAESWISRADQALYFSKANGRNLVRLDQGKN
jgi:PleD family two-component response regulator